MVAGKFELLAIADATANFRKSMKLLGPLDQRLPLLHGLELSAQRSMWEIWETVQ